MRPCTGCLPRIAAQDGLIKLTRENMKAGRSLIAATLLLACAGANAQDALNNILRSSTSTKTTFAVFDVRPGTTSAEAISNEVAAAFKKHYDGIKVMQQMAPYPLPSYAPRMGFQQVQTGMGTVSAPECPLASAIITSSDTTMGKYGEGSILQGCVFPYRDGYRVNVYALFIQKTGGANPMVLGAMLGRAITGAMGIGDSSTFIGETVDDVETRLKALAPSVALVEMQPARPDKSVASDPAPAAPAGMPAAAQAAPAMAGNLPPELMVAQARIAAMVQQQRAAVAAAAPAPAPNKTEDAVQARKDLSAMGLTYYSQEQFVEAARRGDRLACELFLRAGSVKATAADKTGVTPLQATRSPELASFLRSYAP